MTKSFPKLLNLFSTGDIEFCKSFILLYNPPTDLIEMLAVCHVVIFVVFDGIYLYLKFVVFTNKPFDSVA